ncbi:MAG: ATP-binding cassette domain-containing protein [Bacteroidota bacterium]
MIQSNQLTFSYGPETSFQFPDLNCAAGEAMLILGQSGVGKTTFLQCLAGLRRASSGSVRIDKTILGSLSARQLDRFRGQNIGIVYQQPHFLASLSIAENLRLSRKIAGLPKDPQRIKKLAERLGFAHRLHAKARALSVGERQRAAIARALLNHPSVLFADEPTAALDDTNCTSVVSLLKTHSQGEGASLIIVTHDQRLKDHFEQQITL